MGFIEILLTGIGLSMDAFAVSICRGLQMRRRVNVKHLFIIAAFFGGFQALMPAIGYLLGSQFKDYIVAIDHWIAFGLLAFIGGKMLWEGLHPCEEGDVCCLEKKKIVIKRWKVERKVEHLLEKQRYVWAEAGVNSVTELLLWEV